MPLESNPEVKVPVALVTTTYPGASATDIEKLITDRLENKLKSLENLQEITSSSRENVSTLVVKFEANADLTESLRSLRDEVDVLKNDLPGEANDPVVTEVSLSDQPLLTISLLANLPPQEMKNFGEALQDKLEGVPGIAEVTLFGLSEKEIQVFIKRASLEGLQLSLGQILQAIKNNNLDTPIGSLLTNNFYYQISFKSQLEQIQELQQLPIANRHGQNILLGEIAEVREAFVEKTSASRVYRRSTQNSRESITLQIKKKTGANLNQVVRAAKAATQAFQTAVLPDAVEIFFSNDWSKYIQQDVLNLARSGLTTCLIIFSLLFFALGFREALLVSLSVPFIFLTALFGLHLLGETLNSIVLFALILSLGLIVDTSIVIMEGLHTNLKKGLPVKTAARQALRTYRAPLISGTLTTVSAFVPMLMMSGEMGQFVKHIPITINFALGASLLIALLLLPAVTTHLLTPSQTQKSRWQRILSAPFRFCSFLLQKIFALPHRLFQQGLKACRRAYQSRLKRLLHSRLQRLVLTSVVLLAFGVTFSFPFNGVLKNEMFPAVDFDYFNVQIKLPVGSPLKETDRVTAKVEKILETTPELQNFVTILGGSALGITGHAQQGNSQTQTNEAALTINLTETQERKLKSYEIAATVRARLKDFTEAEIKVVELEAGPPSGAPVEIRISGEDLKELEVAAQKIAQALTEVPGTRDITTDLEYGTGKFEFRLKREQLGRYGISAQEVAGFLHTAVFGNDSIKIIRDGEETPIRVALDFRSRECQNEPLTHLKEQRDSLTLCSNTPQEINQLLSLLIPTPAGQVLLSELVEFELKPIITTIRHRDTENVVYVRAYAKAQVLASTIIQALTAKLPALQIPAGIKLDFGGETEETTESYQSLAQSLIVGIFLILLILVWQFNSFRQPLIILFTLPLALIGVFSGLALLGRNFSFPGFIGIAALAGIVVNDAIVLIDRINFNWRKRGPSQEAAILMAAEERFQPIILTTITTALGVLPLAFIDELWGDLAWTIAFGIIFASFLTLFIIPIFYLALEKEQTSASDSEP